MDDMLGGEISRAVYDSASIATPAKKNKQRTKNSANAEPVVQAKTRPWTPSTVEGRWCGFGPYYAMFPVAFARSVVEAFCPPGGAVVDPFCGRGTVPFVAQATGRLSVGCDINPVAWVYAKVKTDPHPNKDDVIARAKELVNFIRPEDYVPENEFQEYAWSRNVLGYLNAARRTLDWRGASIDRTLMGTLLVHLHAKLGDGVSNQMRQSKSMAPLYSVKWWKAKGMLPPEIDVVQFLTDKLTWRYAKGILSPGVSRADIRLDDSRTALPEEFKADLIFTSPPYCGVTNYRYDNWIRLWLLGEGPCTSQGETKQRHSNKVEYLRMLSDSFIACSEITKDDAIVFVRTDARQFTCQTTVSAMRQAWPTKVLYFSPAGFTKATQTALYGDTSSKPGEMDLLMLPIGKEVPSGFSLVPD